MKNAGIAPFTAYRKGEDTQISTDLIIGCACLLIAIPSLLDYRVGYPERKGLGRTMFEPARLNPHVNERNPIRSAARSDF